MDKELEQLFHDYNITIRGKTIDEAGRIFMQITDLCDDDMKKKYSHIFNFMAQSMLDKFDEIKDT